jgi:hypothetical protein
VGSSAIVPAEVEEVAVIAPPSGHHVPIAFYMPAVDVPAGQTETLTVQLTRYFRARKIVVPQVVMPDFQILDFMVGVFSQIAVRTGIPALVFHEGAPHMPFDTAAHQQNISLIVRNITDHASRFTAKLEGLGLSSESWEDDDHIGVIIPVGSPGYRHVTGAAGLQEESEDE